MRNRELLEGPFMIPFGIDQVFRITISESSLVVYLRSLVLFRSTVEENDNGKNLGRSKYGRCPLKTEQK